MESERLNVWLQLIGMAGIVASLIFVGLQLKQSQEIAIGSQYTERSTAAREYWQFLAEHPQLLAGLGVEHRDHLKVLGNYRDDWTDEYVGLTYVNGRAVLANWDDNHYQYELGFITDEGWSPYADIVRRACENDTLIATIIKNHANSLRPSLVEFCLQFAGE